MHLSKLYVEGKLDMEIYTPVFSGSLTVERGGSKTSIRPQARNDRNSGIRAGYLRDRDFDFDPPEDTDVPTVDDSDGQASWGWRLNRHEIESYLLDPRIVAAKFDVEVTIWQERLCEAAKRISWYQVARWTVGYARAQLPPNYKLQTKSDDLKEMRLPDDLSEEASIRWCRTAISEFHKRIDHCLAEDAVSKQIESRRERFLPDLLDEHQYVLKWCSGKDLFAALTEEDLQGTGAENPKLLCNILRDWVREHPEDFVSFFPEIAALKQQMIGAPPPEDTNDSRPLRRIELNDESPT